MKKARINELDVLRGFALLGVYIVHFIGVAFYELPNEESVQELWSSEPINKMVLLFSDIFFLNKANTLFATLFGIGFWIMLERLEESGRDFSKIYLRRLFILLMIGICNTIIFFPGDVLHEYALIGFLLFFLRKLSIQSMLVIGVLLALFARPFIDFIFNTIGISVADIDEQRNAIILSGDYSLWLESMWSLHIQKNIIYGALLSWGLYIFGRFLLGAWLVRKGWLYELSNHLKIIKRLFIICLIIGLGFELFAAILYEGIIESPDWLKETIHHIGAPILAIGYAMGLILLYHSRFQGLMQAVFAPVGRTALTAYVGHSIVFAILFYPLGFSLLSVIPPVMGLMIALATFVLFNLVGRLFLNKLGYGPLEYLWRWATYGQRP